jgi:adenylylsulfate kinase-like enzyme
MKKINRKYGILFWITGFSGSGKTLIAKKIKKKIEKKYGPTILFSGDDIRTLFNLKGYTYNERYETVMKYCKLSKFIISQKINVIFAVVGLMSGIRQWNKKNIKNYLEIYVQSNIKKVAKRKQKKIYIKKSKNIVGIDIKPEFPKNPDIKIINNFDKNLDVLKIELLKKIQFKLSLNK